MQREVVATSSAFDLYNLVPKISVYSQAALLHTPSSVTFLKLLHKFDIRKNSFTKKDQALEQTVQESGGITICEGI